MTFHCSFSVTYVTIVIITISIHDTMQKIPFRERFSGPNSAVTQLIAAAVGAVVFTVFAGLLVYSNTRSLISAAEWVHHTEKVIASLQQASLLTERIDYRIKLFELSKNEEQLNRARASANQLETVAVHLKMLVADNDYQTGNIRPLEQCSQQLTKTTVEFTGPSTAFDAQLQQCHQVIGLMLDHEQSLLLERNKGSQKSSFNSIGTEIGFVALSLITLVVLFGFLLRDAVLRQRLGKQTALSNEQLARTVAALEDRAFESQMLTLARDELQLCVDLQQVYQSCVNSFSRLLAGTSGTLSMINNSRQLVEVVSTWGQSKVDDFLTPESCCGLRSGHARWRRPGISEIHCTHFSAQRPERYLCMPIVAHGNTLGVLYVQCDQEASVPLVEERMDGLRQLVQLTGMAIATLNLRTKLENQSIRDSLTGLFNRHFLQISLERELARAARRKQMLAIFMLDLDHFKRFNDTYGHAAGDMALKTIAEIFRSSVRTEDIACRYGGEEFTIMLPDVTPQTAYERAEGIRRAVSNVRLPFEGEVLSGFSISIGVALYPNDAESGEVLLSRADQALYRAKRSGRNRVVAHETVEAGAVLSSAAVPALS